MSTNSTIARKLDDGRFEALYCHWDGYPSHNGRILETHYTGEDLKPKVDALFALGDLSILGELVSPSNPDKHNFDNKEDGVCVAYHRDRGEDWEGVSPRIFETIEALRDNAEQYLYIYGLESDYTWSQDRGY